jgi:hypothetical protein
MNKISLYLPLFHIDYISYYVSVTTNPAIFLSNIAYEGLMSCNPNGEIKSGDYVTRKYSRNKIYQVHEIQGDGTATLLDYLAVPIAKETVEKLRTEITKMINPVQITYDDHLDGGSTYFSVGIEELIKKKYAEDIEFMTMGEITEKRKYIDELKKTNNLSTSVSNKKFWCPP